MTPDDLCEPGQAGSATAPHTFIKKPVADHTLDGRSAGIHGVEAFGEEQGFGERLGCRRRICKQSILRIGREAVAVLQTQLV